VNDEMSFGCFLFVTALVALGAWAGYWAYYAYGGVC
jgi:hypothetical protein